MAVKNSTIMAKVWLEGTNDFQQRVPEPTQAGLSATMEYLFDPMNRQYYNQFIDILVNKIGYTYARGKRFKNPLGVFKDGTMTFGSTIEEIMPKWVKAHTYDEASETLLKLRRPEMSVFYHSQNRQDRYEITINDTDMRTAFHDEYGLNKVIADLMDVPMNSDEYDEYNIMKNLIAFYEQHWGFYKMNLSGAITDEKTGKEFLTKLRTLVGRLKFPSTLYNCSELTDIPVFAQPEELVLLTTPELEGVLSVEVLASIFHVELADVNVRTVTVDEFPIPGAQALLTTDTFFVCKDTQYRNTSFYNPETLGTTYFLHHWGVYSVSPFAPAILFTTDEGTDTQSIVQNITGLNIAPASAKASLGDIVALTPKLQGTIEPSGQGIVVAPNSVIWTVAAHDSSGEPIQLKSTTRVDNDNKLIIQKTGLKPTDIIDVTAVATYINPSGATSEHKKSIEVTIK